MNDDLSPERRQFLKIGGALLAAAPMVAAAPAVFAAGGKGPASERSAKGVKGVLTGHWANLPKAKGPRLVVVGGGTSGLSVAKYAKKDNPRLDVVLVEYRDMYSSCFCSNLWYPDIINLEFLAKHSFLDAAKNNHYTYFNATCIGLDRDSKIVATSEGDIRYDYVCIAPGIAYDWEKIGIDDIETQTRMRQEYPPGFIDPTEHVTIKRKVDTFEGGTWIQTVPTGNYRCLPAPYERACLIASVIKHKGLKGKVIILDGNPEITIKAPGFHAAFKDFYKGIIEWMPSTRVAGVDLDKKIIHGEVEDFAFDEATIYPNVRASTLIEKLGLMAPTSKTAQKEADIDIRFYNLVGDEHVYVSGDARPMPYSKSGNTSNSEGHFVGHIIAMRSQGKDVKKWESPETLCYSMVNAYPQQAIWVDTHYGYDAKKDAITGFADVKVDNTPSEKNAPAYLAWGRGMYRDMFRA
ncbi:MAG: sulfur oxidation protein, flavocytochrome C [Nevskiaceae bacterium]|nr:MAG: sulfur oxidation protein, flavocytochrome C [Nevskiaceae bacterium]TBR74786.1 MAG: sulfur oxidation protein, flavocytochrome C [Nevskiaceae bacterium]